ncbi:MAG: 4Fe-4S binding protein [Thiotrichales bacterium]|nr:MAG: 4Fe-4S binding protein [Thiotrichales bacterium]
MSNTESTITNMNAEASAAAVAAAERLSTEPTSLIQYSSRGRVAVIGGVEAQDFAVRLCGDLTAQVVLTQGAVEPGVPTIPVGNRPIGIDGHLGDFNIVLGEPGQPNCESVQVDMILDLSEAPLLDMPLKPPGYLTSIAEEPYLSEVEQELKDLVGTFEKPKFFSYDAAICAHGRSGIAGCSLCIDACPADAISSLIESVEVDPHLCQGGGVCASVCPTGAIRYVYPTVTDTLRTLRTLLNSYAEAGGSNAVIALVAEAEADGLANRPDNLLPVVVEELASTGMDVWLSALTYGADAVLLVDAGAMPDSVAGFIRLQIDTAGSILQGLGYPPDAIRIVDPASLAQASETAGAFPLSGPAGFAGSTEKRRTVLQAIDHLYQQSSTATELIPLPAQSPFGRIVVDANACTLCMGCTSVCPSKALGAGNETPKLEFYEINCVQCGICAAACPEKAISLEPRLVADAERRRAMVVLHEEEPFCCIRCGKAFATRSIIDNMTKKLAGHYMFKSERAIERLMMCEDCRVIDVVQDQDAMRSA